MTVLAKSHSPITIEIYREELCEEIGKLIVGVQHEFGVAITYDDQPDLKNIPKVYQAGKGNFWMACDHNRPIGTIALIDSGEGIGVIKKMFVDKPYRGTGIAQQLFDTLLNWAKAKGFHDLYLGTSETFPGAMRFYERNGFRPIEVTALPASVERTRMKVETKCYHRTLLGG